MCQSCEERVARITELEERVLLERVHQAGTDLAMVLGEIPEGNVEGFLVAYAGLRALADSLEATFGPKTVELGRELARRAAAERLALAGYSLEGAH